ncbi:MAG TPA: UDP-N-acetylmuramate dehydrogenase [Desulfobulbus sp.]|nr:UDP-N-acetylmuramate dehydrogenase [Desulfobulbus sp.]
MKNDSGLNREQQRALRSLCGSDVAFDITMARFCTLRAGGPAAALAGPQDLQQLSALLAYCRQERLPWRCIGRGSNILVQDEGFAGILIRLRGKLATIRREASPGIVIAGGGCLLAELLAHCRDAGLSGLEFLVGIPGSVGGSVRMNAGAFGHCLTESLQRLTVVTGDGSVHILRQGEWTGDYRSFTVDGLDMEKTVIAQAEFLLAPSTSGRIEETTKEYLQQRRAKQPSSMPSAGSFFKNPVGDFAGRLIEEAGLKGERVGGAMVSPEHANFIVNAGGATATDIVRLMRLVQEKVRETTGISLEPEVHII